VTPRRPWAGLLVAVSFVARLAWAGGGAVATEHRFAAEAGAATLAAGGSAADAAVTAAAAVCVVHPSSCGIGGGGFALVWHGGKAYALDFREMAPAAARPELYLKDGAPQSARSRLGGLAVAVPGEIAGWIALHRRFGRLPLSVVLAPAIRLAREGVALRDVPHLARQIGRSEGLLRADAGLAAIYLDGGKAPGPEFRLRQLDLARTLEAVAARQRAAFYEGAVAAGIVETVKARGGVLSTDDLARYEPWWRRPLRGTFADRTVLAFPPPGSGGIVLTVLGIVDGATELRGGRNAPTWLRLLSGAFAQGFADRAQWYGDPAFTNVPLDTLLARPRLERVRRDITAGVPRPPADAAHDAGTAHVSVLDADGNAVSLTTTINTAFGSGVLVPGTGIVLNNEMDDFVLAPGAANVYGLGGGAPNLVAPRKRPQSSMSPTIVLRDGRPELVVGGSGGPFIISATTQVVLDVVAFGRSIPDAVADPRLHDQGPPTPILVEPGVPAGAREVLGAAGRKVLEFADLGAAAAVGLQAGRLVAAGDPRKDGGAVVTP
jgi:gamma-glutamyltranspeptidase/glutathione hydrolase